MLTAHFVSSKEHARPSLPIRIAAMAIVGWHVFRQWRHRRLTVHILSSLDPRTLKDIGVDPTEIESAVYGQPNERLRSYQDDWRMRTGA